MLLIKIRDYQEINLSIGFSSMLIEKNIKEGKSKEGDVATLLGNRAERLLKLQKVTVEK